MMLDDIEEHKRTHARLERAEAEAEGRRKAALKRLQEEFQVSTLEEAQALLEQLKKREKETADADYKAKQRFLELQKKYQSKIDAFLEENG